MNSLCTSNGRGVQFTAHRIYAVHKDLPQETQETAFAGILSKNQCWSNSVGHATSVEGNGRDTLGQNPSSYRFIQVRLI